MLTHSKSNYSNDYISAPRGRRGLKFLHALENDQGFLPHTPLGTGVPQRIFYDQNLKKWLKIQLTHAYNFGVRGRNPTKLSHVTCREAGMIIWVQILWGPHPKNLGGQKHRKFGAISDNFGL